MNHLAPAPRDASRRGTRLAFLGTSRGGQFHMFAIAAILIGIVGIFYVRRRSQRKKQQTA